MNNVGNVTAGKPKTTGAIYRAASTVTPVNDATSALSSTDYKPLGYIGEDGVTNANNPTSENIKAWGGDTVLTTQTEKPDTFAMNFIEALNLEVLKAVFGDANVTGSIDGTDGIKITANATEQTEHVWVIDTILKGNVAKRLVIPKGKITEVGDVVYKDNEAVGYAVTISALPDSNGNTHYEYIKKLS